MADIQDGFEELIGKGSEMFSNLSEMAGDLAVRVKIKAQLLDQNLEYDGLMKKLGEAVYEEVKRDERYTSAHPSLFAKIVEVDQRRKALEEEYARLEAQDQEQGESQDPTQDQASDQSQADQASSDQPEESKETGALPQGDAE